MTQHGRGLHEADIGPSASSLFFMQSELFLAHQRHLERGHNTSPGQNIGALCDAMHEHKPVECVRRIQGVLNMAKKYGAAACEDACAAALELCVP